MNNFEAAVELSLNNWVASLPTEFDLPEPTQAYKKEMARLMDKMRGDRYHRLTRRTARALLIAAVILAIATITLAATVGRDFVIQKFTDHSTYSVVDASDIRDVDDISIEYIPEGFELSKNIRYDKVVLLTYSKEDEWLNIYKGRIDSDVAFDTEYKNSESLKIHNFNSIYYEDTNLNYSGIVWNDGTHIYTVEGNISKDELIKIAENIT